MAEIKEIQKIYNDELAESESLQKSHKKRKEKHPDT